MSSFNGIMGAFATLLANGCHPPAEWAQDAVIDDEGRPLTPIAAAQRRLAVKKLAAQAWMRVLEGVDDEVLHAAVARHLGTAEGRFWPVPGRLLLFLRPEERPALPGPVDDGGGCPRYNALAEFERDLVMREASARDKAVEGAGADFGDVLEHLAEQLRPPGFGALDDGERWRILARLRGEGRLWEEGAIEDAMRRAA